MSKRSLNEEINDLVNGLNGAEDFYDEDEIEEGGITTTQRINSLSRGFVDDSDDFSFGGRATSMKAKASEPELDDKFSGKKVSREDLSRWFAGEDDDEEEGEEEEENDEDDFMNESDEEQSGDKDEMMTKAAAEAERLHKELLRGSGKGKSKEEAKFSIIDKKSIEMDFQKAKETKTQNSLWEVFVESRIKLQQSLNLINGNSPLFRSEKIASIDVTNEKSSSLGSEKTSTEDQLQTSRKLVAETFAACMDVMRGLWDQNAEVTSSCGKYDDAAKASIDTSDAEDDATMTSFDRMATQFKRGERAFMTGFCAPVLDRWYQRTQIGGINSAGDARGSKKFKLVNQDINTQIDQVLRDRQRLVQRTRINRLRNDDDVTGSQPASKRAKLGNEKVNYDSEIFDDTDFYGDLLRELIDAGSGGDGRDSLLGDDGGANSELNRIKNLRKKSKRANSNASNKGRRLKYDVIPELVSFMAPVDSSNESRTEWDTQQLYSNLFAAK